MRNIIKNVIFRACVGGLMYGGIEILYDNSSDRSMLIVGALAFIIGGEFSIKFKQLSVRAKSFWIANIVTFLELIGGVIWNSDLTIWNYEKFVIVINQLEIPLHFKGQICIPFWFIWFGISPLIIWLTDKLKDEKIDLGNTYKQMLML